MSSNTQYRAVLYTTDDDAGSTAKRQFKGTVSTLDSTGQNFNYNSATQGGYLACVSRPSVDAFDLVETIISGLKDETLAETTRDVGAMIVNDADVTDASSNSEPTMVSIDNPLCTIKMAGDEIDPAITKDVVVGKLDSASKPHDTNYHESDGDTSETIEEKTSTDDTADSGGASGSHGSSDLSGLGSLDDDDSDDETTLEPSRHGQDDNSHGDNTPDENVERTTVPAQQIIDQKSSKGGYAATTYGRVRARHSSTGGSTPADEPEDTSVETYEKPVSVERDETTGDVTETSVDYDDKPRDFVSLNDDFSRALRELGDLGTGKKSLDDMSSNSLSVFTELTRKIQDQSRYVQSTSKDDDLDDDDELYTSHSDDEADEIDDADDVDDDLYTSTSDHNSDDDVDDDDTAPDDEYSRVIDTIFPESVDNILDAKLDPGISEDYYDYMNQDTLDFILNSTRLSQSQMYSNQLNLSDGVNDLTDADLARAKRELAQTLRNNPSRRIVDYAHSQQQLREFTNNLERQADEVVQEYQRDEDEWIAQRVEELRLEYRREHPDYSQDVINQMYEDASDELAQYQNDMEDLRHPAMRDLVSRLRKSPTKKNKDVASLLLYDFQRDVEEQSLRQRVNSFLGAIGFFNVEPEEDTEEPETHTHTRRDGDDNDTPRRRAIISSKSVFGGDDDVHGEPVTSDDTADETATDEDAEPEDVEPDGDDDLDDVGGEDTAHDEQQSLVDPEAEHAEGHDELDETTADGDGSDETTDTNETGRDNDITDSSDPLDDDAVPDANEAGNIEYTPDIPDDDDLPDAGNDDDLPESGLEATPDDEEEDIDPDEIILPDDDDLDDGEAGEHSVSDILKDDDEDVEDYSDYKKRDDEKKAKKEKKKAKKRKKSKKNSSADNGSTSIDNLDDLDGTGDSDESKDPNKVTTKQKLALGGVGVLGLAAIGGFVWPGFLTGGGSSDGGSRSSSQTSINKPSGSGESTDEEDQSGLYRVGDEINVVVDGNPQQLRITEFPPGSQGGAIGTNGTGDKFVITQSQLNHYAERNPDQFADRKQNNDNKQSESSERQAPEPAGDNAPAGGGDDNNPPAEG